MKYAKWKAVEIDRCLKNGITPTPGPPGEQSLEDEATGPAPPVGFNIQPPDPYPGPSYGGSSDPPPGPPSSDTSYWDQPPQPSQETKPTPKPRQTAPPPQATPSYDQYGGGSMAPPPATTRVQLGPHEITSAQKLCRFASSALEYEDVQGAMEYLEKAMRLLKTGKEEG